MVFMTMLLNSDATQPIAISEYLKQPGQFKSLPEYFESSRSGWKVRRTLASGRFKRFDGFRKPPLLCVDHAEDRIEIGRSRLDLQAVPADLLGR